MREERGNRDIGLKKERKRGRKSSIVICKKKKGNRKEGRYLKVKKVNLCIILDHIILHHTTL